MTNSTQAGSLKELQGQLVFIMNIAENASFANDPDCSAREAGTKDKGLMVRLLEERDISAVREMMVQHHATTAFRTQRFSDWKLNRHFATILSHPPGLVCITVAVSVAWAVADSYVLSHRPLFAAVHVIAVGLSLSPVRWAEIFGSLVGGIRPSHIYQFSRKSESGATITEISKRIVPILHKLILFLIFLLVIFFGTQLKAGETSKSGNDASKAVHLIPASQDATAQAPSAVLKALIETCRARRYNELPTQEAISAFPPMLSFLPEDCRRQIYSKSTLLLERNFLTVGDIDLGYGRVNDDQYMLALAQSVTSGDRFSWAEMIGSPQRIENFIDLIKKRTDPIAFDAAAFALSLDTNLIDDQKYSVYRDRAAEFLSFNIENSTKWFRSYCEGKSACSEGGSRCIVDFPLKAKARFIEDRFALANEIETGCLSASAEETARLVLTLRRIGIFDGRCSSYAQFLNASSRDIASGYDCLSSLSEHDGAITVESDVDKVFLVRLFARGLVSRQLIADIGKDWQEPFVDLINTYSEMIK
ncbi:hypothetical protein [Rhizobium hidalgonense]|uniref:hypothetical protein n=1 Tax=Rhizobium hidalgonense TaxID=1538159 RepID=UPI00287135B5|nr:hypothetical protein [Rhizobium hidalgonense]MDR9805484.1 hypothetical protein [Rhizobium hidalgonense]